MAKITCHLKLGEVPLHLFQIIAGFQLLERQDVIKLKVTRLSKRESMKLPYNMMEVIVNGTIRVLYDVNDGYDNLIGPHEDYAEWMDRLLSQYDYCFKRSFSPKYNATISNRHKLHPLGLNYMATVRGNKAHVPAPGDPRREKIKKAVRMVPFHQYYNGLYRLSAFEDVPRIDAKPRILFMARLWDVDGEFPGQLSDAKKEERARINEVRAQCIRLCREQFGDSFFGGISPSAYACKHYPDLVIRDKGIVKRNAYMQQMKASSICIATMGLHESIGWKFAEYVAASKSIVTEKLHYEVPGNFSEENNYLSFSAPDECVDKIERLMRDDGFRYRMMVNNYEYYHNYVRADRLVLNSLIGVLEGTVPL